MWKWKMLKNKKAQEFDLSMGGVLMGILGAVIGILIVKQMPTNIFMKILSVGVTAIVCYFIAAKILDD